MRTFTGWQGSASTAHQRLLSSDRKWVALTGGSQTYGLLVDNGHCYGANDEPIKSTIIGNFEWRLPEFQRHSNAAGHAATLVKAYQEHGTGCVELLTGHFALAIIDSSANQSLLCVDHFATIPIYYVNDRGNLFFSTNISDLRKLADIQPRIDPQALYNYLYFHCVPSPGTVFPTIQKTRAASLVLTENGSTKPSKYWLPNFQTTHLPDAKWKKALMEKLDTAVRRCSPSHTTGSFLSGGLDSSTISGVLKHNEPNARAFSIGFDEDGYDEMEYARIAAKHFGIELVEYYVTADDVADAFPLIASAYDEPFGNSSAIPTFFCAKLAKSNGADKLLAGDGGDELFAGNTRYRKQQIFNHYGKIPSLLRTALLEPLGLKLPTRHLFPSKLRSYISQAKIPMPERLETYNLLERETLTQMFHPEFLETIDHRQPRDLQRDVFHEVEDADF
ncbi:MAG: asparagine synthase-related protein, partial [Pseudomonadota bacterium]